MCVAGGNLVEVLKAMLHLHDLALVAEVLLVSDEYSISVVALIVCLKDVKKPLISVFHLLC